MEKLKDFEVILKSLDKIRDEVDDLKVWIKFQILEAKKSAPKDPNTFAAHNGGGSHEHENELEHEPLDNSNVEMLIDVNPYIKTENVTDTEDSFNPGEEDGGQFDIEEADYEEPNYVPVPTADRRQSASSTSRRTRIRKPTPPKVVKPVVKPTPIKPKASASGPIVNFKTAKYIRSKRANCYVLVADNFTYFKNKNNPKSMKTNWNCTERKLLCKATALTFGPVGENEVPEILKVDPSEHYHPPNPTDVKVKEAISTAKRRAIEAPGSSAREVYNEIITTSLLPDEIAQAPKYGSLIRTLNSVRKT